MSFDVKNLIGDYGDIRGEVNACRTSAALFDFSFMFVAKVSGRAALDIIKQITDRNFGDMDSGKIRYALSYSSEGFLRSDLTIWKISTDTFFVMSGLGKDIDALISHSQNNKDCHVEDLTKKIAVYSIQGPESLKVLNGIVNDERLSSIPYFGCAEFNINELYCLIGRLGYTGERGFELVLPLENDSQIWRSLSKKARPCGFSAMDRLRIEAGFVLFANEFKLSVSAGDVSLEKFTAKNLSPPSYRLICFEAETDQALDSWSPGLDIFPPLPGCISVTSACHQTDERGGIGLGFILKNNNKRRQQYIDPLGRFTKIVEVKKPYYDTLKKRPRGSWI